MRHGRGWRYVIGFVMGGVLGVVGAWVLMLRSGKASVATLEIAMVALLILIAIGLALRVARERR
jgi:heme/copper-type cytochrome/quinol oxidase subunit 4